MLKTKVCGMKNPFNMQQLWALAPDFMGLIFYPPSPRFIAPQEKEIRQTLEQLQHSTKNLQQQPLMTGVFVNPTLPYIRQQVEQFDLAAIQLHGTESPLLCRELQDLGLKVIKAFGIAATFDWSLLGEYAEATDYFLFDTRSGNKTGGTGQQFDWNLLENYTLETPYFLSGGIGENEVKAVMERQKKDNRLYGIDLNSKFETAPGEKDIDKLAETFKQLRNG